MKNNKGFTLLEILVVGILLAVLSVIGIPLFQKAVERGRTAEIFSNMPAIRSQMNIYLMGKRAGAACTVNINDFDAELPLTATAVAGVYRTKFFEYTFTDDCKVEIARVQNNDRPYKISFWATGREAAGVRPNAFKCESDEELRCAQLGLNISDV